MHGEQPELLRVFIERAKAEPRVTGLAEYSAGQAAAHRAAVRRGSRRPRRRNRCTFNYLHLSVNYLHLSSRMALDNVTAVSRRYPGSGTVAETTLHHLALCHEDLDLVGVRGKVNPPIRSRTTTTRSGTRCATAG